MKPYFEHTCHRCGEIGELDFNFAGPHIKAVCSGCGFYVKFFDKSLLPDPKELKMKIMILADNNIQKIIERKSKLGIFYDGISGMNAKIAYWKLYISFIKESK
jgi:hypothetical protein